MFVPEIEGLRGLLSIIVLCAHVHTSSMFWAWGTMEVFFAISGFLIGRQIFVYRDTPHFYKTYFVRRALRIWPLYYTMLLIAIGANAVWGWLKYDDPWHRLSWGQVLIPTVFLQNVSKYFSNDIVGLNDNDVPYHFGHSWSVAIEEQFYLLAPLLLLIMGRTLSKGIWAVIVLVAILGSMVYRVDHSYWLLVSRLDGFAVGLFIAVLWMRPPATPDERSRIGIGFAGVLVYSACVVGHYLYKGYAYGFGDEVFGRRFTFEDPLMLFLANPYVGFAGLGGCIIYLAAFRERVRVLAPLRSPIFLYLGRISYSTYLSHVMLVHDVVPRMLGTYDTEHVTIWNYVLSLGFSIGLAHLLYTYVERPFMNRKPRFSRSEGRGAQAVENTAAPP